MRADLVAAVGAVSSKSNRGGFLSFGALGAVIFWGISFVATRVALEAFHPLGLVAIRFAAGTSLLWVILAVSGKDRLPRREDWPLCTMLGLVLGAHIGIQAFGLLYTSAINTAWIVAFMPVTIALGAQAFFGQRLTGVGWAGAAIALLGVVIVTWSVPPNFEDAQFGDLLQLSTCLTWTAYTLLSAKPVQRNGSMSVTAWCMAIASVLAGGGSAFFGLTVAPLTTEAVAAAAFLGLACSGVAFALWNRALSVDGASKVGAMLYFEPLITVGVAAVFLAEPVTTYVLLGGPVVLFGVWVMGRAAGVKAS